MTLGRILHHRVQTIYSAVVQYMASNHQTDRYSSWVSVWNCIAISILTLGTVLRMYNIYRKIINNTNGSIYQNVNLSKYKFIKIIINLFKI